MDASSQPDGKIVSYQWTQTAGGLPYTYTSNKQGLCMKIIELTVDDTVFEKVLNFLELLPKDKIKLHVSDTPVPSRGQRQILSVDDTEQQEIETILRNKECHQAVRSKAVVI